MNKIHGKITDDPTVYILPLENRKKMSSQGKSPQKDEKSIGKTKMSEPSRSKPKLNEL